MFLPPNNRQRRVAGEKIDTLLYTMGTVVRNRISNGGKLPVWRTVHTRANLPGFTFVDFVIDCFLSLYKGNQITVDSGCTTITILFDFHKVWKSHSQQAQKPSQLSNCITSVYEKTAHKLPHNSPCTVKKFSVTFHLFLCGPPQTHGHTRSPHKSTSFIFCCFFCFVFCQPSSSFYPSLHFKTYTQCTKASKRTNERTKKKN